MSARIKINLSLFTALFLLCITPLAVLSQSDDQNMMSSAFSLSKTNDIFDRAIGSLDKGEMLVRNLENYGMLGYTGPFTRHGLFGDLRWFLFMAGMRPGPWGANIQTQDLGVVDRNDQYNVIESFTCNLAANGPGVEFSDWDAKDDSRYRLFSDDKTESMRPVIASSDITESWPEGYYDQSGTWTDTPGERHWPGPWAIDNDPASQTYLLENYGNFVSDRDIYYIMDDKYNGIRAGYELGTGYPVGLDIEVTGYSWANPYYEDIVFLNYDIVFRDDIASEDPDRQFYDGTIDSVYFGFFMDPDLPGRDYLNQWCDPWAVDDFALVDTDNDVLLMFEKRGWTEDLDTGNDAQSGPVSVYSLGFISTPGDAGITDFHFFDSEMFMNNDGGPYMEKSFYSFLAGQPEILASDADRNVLFHASTSDPTYPHFDNADSLLRYNEFDAAGNPFPTFYQNESYQRPDIMFTIGIGPVTLSPGTTYPLHFTVFGSNDNPGTLDQSYYDFPVNTPYFNNSGLTDMTDRFADVYDNLDVATKLYANTSNMTGHLIKLTSATGGETINGSYDITWTATSVTTDPINSMDILISDDRGTEWDTLAVEESNDGTFTLDTSLLTDGIFYRALVIGTDGALIGADQSGSDITINNPGDAAPQIMLIEHFTDLYRLLWLGGDADGDQTVVTIQYSPDDANWLTIYEDQAPSDTLDWQTETVPFSNAAKLRLIISDGTLADTAYTGSFDYSLTRTEMLDSTQVDHKSGYGNQPLYFIIANNAAMDDHLYEATFDDITSPGMLYYSVSDITASAVKIDNEPLYEQVEGSLFAGYRLQLEPQALEFRKSSWTTGGGSNWTIDDLSASLVPMPGYYEIRYMGGAADSAVVSTSSRAKSSVKILPFQIWNMAYPTGPAQVYMKFSGNPNTVWGSGQTITFYEEDPNNPSFLQSTWYTAISFTVGSEIAPQVGDVYAIETTIPISSADVFRFSTIPTPVANDKILPDAFRLHQNYPNPFNPETTIRFELPAAADVRINVYNILGKEVATVTNQGFAAGEHSVKWNGRNSFGSQVSSGMYFYRIEAGTFVKTMKMVLLR
ncbi:FlgD immunoglobulin-like domain containing protein [candidate division KSB1 bacterium]